MADGSYQKPLMSVLRREGRLFLTADRGPETLDFFTTPRDEVEVRIEAVDDEHRLRTCAYTLTEDQALQLAHDLKEMVERKREIKALLDKYALDWAHNAVAVKGVNEERQ